MQREFDIAIERLSDEGRGIGFADGKTVFVAGALPGEQVRARTIAEKNQWVEAELIARTTSAPARIAPRCPLFGRCGGCQLQMLDEDAQLAHKQQVLQRLLRPFGAEHWDAPLTAAPWSYRHRARLTVTAMGERPAVGFKGAGSHEVIEVPACPILDARLQPLLDALPHWLAQLTQWRRLEEILIAVDADGVVALDWNAQRAFPKSDAEKLATLAEAAGVRCGNAVLRYAAPSVGNEFAFSVRDFTQVNPAINDQLVQRALAWLAPQRDEQIADLFCGLGNFALPLARAAQRVTGFESGAAMVERARAHAGQQDLANAEFQVLDLFEQADELPDRFDKILLDPPRAGARAVCERLARSQRVQRVVYVSCNPQTLARDLGILHARGFRLERAALVDMFPQTGHCEVIVQLNRGG